eukprot:m.125698 g.125698  ORF g.125698 m.125698 type:complete len:146 (+) comp17337_c0_seq7:196-633(+)
MLAVLESIAAIVTEHPLLIVVISFFLFNKYLQSRPFPESGGTVVSIDSDIEWSRIMSLKDFALVDFYATWCPPCRAAAPVFGRMSTQYNGITFAKTNVDTCAAIAKQQGISAMPTFKLYKKGMCVDTLQVQSGAAAALDNSRIHG